MAVYFLEVLYYIISRRAAMSVIITFVLVEDDPKLYAKAAALVAQHPEEIKMVKIENASNPHSVKS